MTNIVDFLTARYDELQARAQDAFSGDWRFNLGTHDVEAGDVDDARDVCYVYGRDSEWDTGQGAANGRHIALHGPRYVLADIAAKRRILERHTTGVLRHYRCSNRDHIQDWQCERAGDAYDETRYCEVCDVDCDEPQALASPFAEHPDYESWLR